MMGKICIDIDKMNDCLTAGLADIRVESYNDHGWQTLLNVYCHHSVPTEHPAIPAIFDDMLKNSKRKNPKSHFENYRLSDLTLEQENKKRKR